MTATRLHGTLPIRRWLALALASMFIVPAFTMVAIGFILFRDTQGPTSADSEAVAILRDGADRWDNPAWQSAMGEELSARDVDVVLFEGDQEIYRTAQNPLSGSGDTSRLVRQVEFTDADPQRTAVIYSNQDQGPPEELRVWFVPVALFTALGLTLTGIAWFLRRSVVAPLTATSLAAQQVAQGELDVALPSSRVREVAQLNHAFAAMSGALRASLQQQVAMEQERKLFIGAIAHDLRTPLFSLRGSLEGIKEGVADTPEKRDRYIDVALDKSEALERLISDLFTFTRLEYLEQAPDRAQLDLAALLSRLVEGARAQADTREIDITLDGAPTPCMVHADSHLLTRAVENLLDNAIRHTSDGGTIRVEWQRSPRDVRFTVADSGPGIPAEDLPKLFTPLFRGEQSRNRKTGGAGLGLAIARRIMVAHGGDLTAANASSGGAVFTGVLPLGQEITTT